MATKKYVTAVLDLTEFELDFIELVRPSLIMQVETNKGLISDANTLTCNCLGCIAGRFASLPSSASSVLPLTGEMKEYYESVGIPYSSDK